MILPRLALSVIAAALWVAAIPVRANGDRFFESKEIPGNAEFVIFGSVRDTKGRYLAKASVTVSVPVHQLEFTVITDILGRFRTPDIGRAIKDLGYEVDPNLIVILVDYPGYQVLRRENRGRHGQKKGAIEINLRMERVNESSK